MTACIFVGPTLSRAEVATQLDAICLPPVAQGDVLRAVRRHGPRMIGIIDGFFGGAPAVWHKEILWAMAEGVAVFGAASMGALRAAELHGFGMRGVGRIFEAYRDGLLEDDDEVAVTHGPAELGYAVLSEPMVNIRETLAKAVADAVLRPASRDRLAERAKSLPFAERCWPTILECVGPYGIDAGERTRFRDWLETGRVDLKRDDARAMLAAMRAHDTGAEQLVAGFHFETTHYWASLAAQPDPKRDDAEDEITHRVLDELRLGPQAVLRSITARALLRFAADMSGRRGGVADDPADLDRATAALRSTLGLYSQRQYDDWMAENDLHPAAFRTLAAGSARLDHLSQGAAPLLSRYLIDELRLSQDYKLLAARAHRKAACLAADASNRREASRPPDRLALRQWFAERRLGPGGDPDLGTLLKATGFSDAAILDRALHLERLYLKLISPSLDD